MFSMVWSNAFVTVFQFLKWKKCLPRHNVKSLIFYSVFFDTNVSSNIRVSNVFHLISLRFYCLPFHVNTIIVLQVFYVKCNDGDAVIFFQSFFHSSHVFAYWTKKSGKQQNTTILLHPDCNDWFICLFNFKCS